MYNRVIVMIIANLNLNFFFLYLRLLGLESFSEFICTTYFRCVFFLFLSVCLFRFPQIIGELLLIFQIQSIDYDTHTPKCFGAASSDRCVCCRHCVLLIFCVYFIDLFVLHFLLFDIFIYLFIFDYCCCLCFFVLLARST